MNNRSRSVIKNAIWEMGYYIIVILLGFLAPRYIILTYGSEVNGLSSTITQILNVILLMQAGAATASVFSLYKPIAEENYDAVSDSLSASDNFFKKLSWLFLFVMLIVALISSFAIKTTLSRMAVFFAFVIMGTKSFVDIYYISKFRILFTAFQQKYIISIATLIEQIVYYLLVFLVIYLKLHFLLIFFSYLCGCVIRVLYLQCKFNKTFASKIVLTGNKNFTKIQGRVYALANEISHSIIIASPMVIISFIYGLKEASVLSVYMMIYSGLNLVSTAIYSAFSPSFGNLVACDDKNATSQVFFVFQYMYILFNTFLMMCMMYLTIPFVCIYTHGVTDVNYVNFTLLFLIALNGTITAFRVPYNIVVSTHGFFRETCLQPVITAIVALAISVGIGYMHFEFVWLGSIFFFAVNFVYQHLKLKQLASHLISKDCFSIILGSILCLLFSCWLAKNFPLRYGIMHWCVGATVFSFVAMMILILSSVVFMKKYWYLTITYLKLNYWRKHNV